MAFVKIRQGAIAAGLAVSILAGGLSVGAQAAALPHISATVTGGTTIHVVGTEFGPGDLVLVEDSVGGRVLTRASRIILPPPSPCKPGRLCTPFLPVLGGFIAVSLPPFHVACLERLVTVRAIDVKRHTASNTTEVVLGTGLCH